MSRWDPAPDYAVDPDTGCWNWLKSKTKFGYPSDYGHRRYYIAAGGEVPAGWHVHHKCENASCVNPDHLQALSHDDHLVLHHLERKGLTLADLRAIYELGRERHVSARKVAEDYGLTHWSIYYIWKGVNWHGLLGLPPIEPDAGTCPQCGGEVVGHRHKVYCSPRCRSNAGAKRRRAGIRTPGGSRAGVSHAQAVAVTPQLEGQQT